MWALLKWNKKTRQANQLDGLIERRAGVAVRFPAYCPCYHARCQPVLTITVNISWDYPLLGDVSHVRYYLMSAL